MNPVKFSTTLRAVAAAAMLMVAVPGMAAPKQQLSADVGKPLQEAQAALSSKDYKGALAKIKEAEAKSKKSPYETYVINQMRGAAAAGAGDMATAATSFEAALATGQVPPEDALKLQETVVQVYYSAKNFPKTIEALNKYKSMGGNKPAVLGLAPQALYLGGKYAEAAKELSAQIVELEKAGKQPTETQLQLLASCALKQNDMNAYLAALQRLCAYYPKKTYWLDLTLRTAGKQGFSDKLSLDVYRLRFANGTIERASDYMEATQLALQAGLPGEAEKYLNEGYTAKMLGTGADASRHERLKKLVAKSVADDKAILASADKQAASAPSGDPLVATGLNYVGYGEFDKGIKMMQDGIKKGGLKSADHANLHLGYALMKAGKKADAVAAFKKVAGKDGSGDLAKLWVIQLR